MARSLTFKNLMRILGEEMAKTKGFSSSRREFLTKTAYGSAATMVLAGCSSFDRWVVGDSNHLEQEVMVLGAGIAGLSAAYHLKKNKIPYRVFEASERVGGRIQTMQHANPDEQFAELGAEFFEASHASVHQLCKDLNLAVQDVTYDPKIDRALYWLNGKVVSEKEFRKNLKPLIAKLAQTKIDAFASFSTEINPRSLVMSPGLKEIDQQSLADLMGAVRGAMDEATLQCFENLCVSEWGVDSKNINLLHFLVKLDLEEKSNRTTPPKFYRAEGGMSRMAQILAERVQGIVPETNLKLAHQLISVRAKSGGYECTFRTSKGSDTIWARQVICTLPFSVLKDIDGIQTLQLGAAREVIAAATYATHSKVISSFREPPWKKKAKGTPGFQGVFRGQLLGQSYWDSSRGQVGTRGLMTSQRGGNVGQSTGVSAAQETVQDLRNFYKDLAAEESALVVNWSQKPYAKGSRLNIQPGGYMKFLEALVEENNKENFFLGGEHWSFADAGTMNGAIESGIAAAEKSLQKAFRSGSF
jgi:monoamine oxidase